MYLFRFSRERDQSRLRRGGGGGGGGNRFNIPGNIGGNDMNHGNSNGRFMGRGRGNSIHSGMPKNKIPGGNLRKLSWDVHTLQPLRKDFYIEHPAVKNRYDLYNCKNRMNFNSQLQFRSNEEVNQFRVNAEITVKGNDIPNPIQYFDEGNFPNYVMEGIRKQGYSQPTPIQAQGWPIALSGRDLVAIAQTGSGKTLGVSLKLTYIIQTIQDNKCERMINFSTFYLPSYIL